MQEDLLDDGGGGVAAGDEVVFMAIKQVVEEPCEERTRPGLPLLDDERLGAMEDGRFRLLRLWSQVFPVAAADDTDDMISATHVARDIAPISHSHQR